MPSGSADLGDLHKVWEVKPLKKAGEDEARRILQSIAKQVQPIMRKHKWRVKILSEFCPSNARLLGVNQGGGSQVKLRLRRHDRISEFLPYEQVLDTMLHELCHNVHGPHNASFYNLWDAIRKECEDLIAKGVTGTGQGFDAPGRRLGGFSHTPPLSSLRQVTLHAAERRAQLSALLPSGPRRLGGDSNIMSSLSPIQAAAMAAERRLHDDLWCGAESYDDPCGTESDTMNHRQSSVKRHFEVLNSSMASNMDMSKAYECSSKLRIPKVPRSEAKDFEDHDLWECGTCTLLNQPLALACGACGAIKASSGRKKFKIWTCKFCTLENKIELEKCTACMQWRYSYGPPVSIRGPNNAT
ncbi:DNA-dependent metalloprotease WSS1 isoform X2 [Nymphaea colorata]|uniref:DNA-dependent metalloprotease WSS1 isoform X2 n=1 Tax=Nymphaea colorata TaxID=210225 RepID=UPI00129E6393|nr:DNA-dependent metalloprotease WSS1 isoform X2 [Nymphaea colorata]